MKKTQITKAYSCGRRIRYALLSSIGEDGTRRYGVAVSCGGEEAEIQDITSDLKKMLTWIIRLQRGCVTPFPLRDIVNDWLLE